MSPNPHHNNRHLIAYGFAGVVSIAYYYWKNQNRKRKDADANVLMNGDDYETIMSYCNQMADQPKSAPTKNNCIYLDYNGTTVSERKSGAQSIVVYSCCILKSHPYQTCTTTARLSPRSGSHASVLYNSLRKSLLGTCLW
jgi:hypothetical protein